MRYWFVALGLLIVIRTFLWLLKEHRERHRRLRHLPDAGTVGRLLVLEGNGILEEGTELILPYEGSLGSDRTCDVCIPDPELPGELLDFSFQPQLGMLVYPRSGMTCLVDGEELNHRSRPRLNPLRHGSVLELGNIKLRVRLFEGLQTDGEATLMPDEPELPPIPNEGYMNTAELPVVHIAAEEQPAPQERPAAQPADPFAQSDRQKIVRLYEDTEEAGAPAVRKRSSWRHDDDAQ